LLETRLREHPRKKEEWTGMALAVLQKAGVALPPSFDLTNAEYLLIYFSAAWCPPCRAFTPHLAAWVTEHASRHKAVALFVSGDRTAEDAAQYNAKMGFPMAVFNNAAFGALMGQWGLTGIPSLVVLKVSDGSVVTKRAREKLMSDPAAFPWPAAEGEEESGVMGGVAEGCVRLLAVVALLAWGAYKLKGFF
jgi:nucleoredoxin